MTPTPEQVADWAREADCLHMYYIHPLAMERFAALVADWQRERDARPEFLLFAGDDYYPAGGANDLLGRFETPEAAIAAHDPSKFGYDGGWANILRLSDLMTIKTFSRGVWSDCAEPGKAG